MTTTDQKELKFKATELEEVYTLAKQKGYNVFAYLKDDRPISYLHYENKEGQIGYVEVGLCGLTFSSVHKPGTQNGTGFRISEEFDCPSNLDKGFIHMPHWAQGTIEKYADFAEYKKKSILEYTEI